MKRIHSLIAILSIILFSALVVAACGTTQPESVAAPIETPTVESVPEDENGEEEEAEEHMEDEEEHDDAEGEHAEDEEEHMGEDSEHEHLEVPPTYEGLTNPFDGDADAISAGAELFSATCESCHGPQGKGDGPAAAALDPRPATLADADMMADMTDGYIFWRITEGGAMEPFNSAMPAWGSTFSEQEVWQLIAFLRTLPDG
jgi:mono/diheme cytochrome c family protein